MADIFKISSSNNKIWYTIGILGIPNTGDATFAPVGNINISDIQNKFTGADGQHYFIPPGP